MLPGSSTPRWRAVTVLAQQATGMAASTTQPIAIGLVIAASLVIGWWACTVTAERMRVLDPGNIVWDEVVAFWIVLWLLMPAGFWGQLIAFALFRFFDAVKPGPVAWADNLFHGFGWRGGFGIIFDDLVAAFCTLLVIAIWRFWS